MLPAAQRVWAKPLGHAAVDAVPVLLVAGVSIRPPTEILRRQLGELLADRLSCGLEMRSHQQQVQELDDGANYVGALGEPQYGAQPQVLLRRLVVLVQEEELGLHPTVLLWANRAHAEQTVLASPDEPVPELLAGEEVPDERVGEHVPARRAAELREPQELAGGVGEPLEPSNSRGAAVTAEESRDE